LEVRINGLDKLLKKLDKLGGNIEQSTQKALLQGGAIFEAAAKANCPVDTGYLRDSIHTESRKNVVTVGTNCNYAIYVEYGTGPKGDPSVPHTARQYWRYQDAEGNWHTSHGQAPQPFMRTAFAQEKDNAVRAVKESIEADIRGLMNGD
jgi:HK97 gp10 family phage protein